MQQLKKLGRSYGHVRDVGSLGDAFLALRMNTEQLGTHHADLAVTLQQTVVDRMESVRERLSKEQKRLVQDGQAIRKDLDSSRNSCHKCLSRYDQTNTKLEMLEQALLDAETRDDQKTIDKVRGKVSSAEREKATAEEHFRSSVTVLHHMRETYDARMSHVLNEMQKSIEERRQTCVSESLRSFASVFDAMLQCTADVGRECREIAGSIRHEADMETLVGRMRTGAQPSPEIQFRPIESKVRRAVARGQLSVSPTGAAIVNQQRRASRSFIAGVAERPATPEPERPMSDEERSVAARIRAALVAFFADGDAAAGLDEATVAASIGAAGADVGGGPAGGDETDVDEAAAGECARVASVPHNEAVSVVDTLLETAFGRKHFARRLNQLRQRRVELARNEFTVLVGWTRTGLQRASQGGEFSTARLLLNMSCTFFCAPGDEEPAADGGDEGRTYVQAMLRGDPVWGDTRLWEEIFFDSLTAEYKKFGGVVPARGDGAAGGAAADGGVQGGSQVDSNIVYSQLVPFVWNMIDFGVPGGDVSAFVDKMCFIHGVDDAAREMLAMQIRTMMAADEDAVVVEHADADTDG